MTAIGRRLRVAAAGAAMAWLPVAEAHAAADGTAGDVTLLIEALKKSLVSGCWSCETMNNVVDIGLGVADQAFTALAGECANLLGLLMALWLLFLAGKMFLPFGPDGQVGSLWNEGAKKLLRFAVVLAFLQGSQPFWDYVFIPLLGAGMGLASRVISLSDGFEAQGGMVEDAVATGSETYCQPAAGNAGLGGAQAIMHQMDCALSKIQSQFGKGMLVGAAVIYGAAKPVAAPGAGSGAGSFLPDIANIPNLIWEGLSEVVQIVDRLVCGSALIVIYFFGFILFPFTLIDVVMRVSVVTVISPVAMAASMFKPTQRIAEKTMWNLAQSGLTLVFASVAAGIAKAALAYAYSHLPTADGQSLSNWDALIAALENGKLAISLFTSSFYALAGIGVILLYMIRQAGKMAAEFTGAAQGEFSGAGSAVANMVGSAFEKGGNALQAGKQAVFGGGGRGGRQFDRGLAPSVTGGGSDG